MRASTSRGVSPATSILPTCGTEICPSSLTVVRVLNFSSCRTLISSVSREPTRELEAVVRSCAVATAATPEIRSAAIRSRLLPMFPQATGGPLHQSFGAAAASIHQLDYQTERQLKSLSSPRYAGLRKTNAKAREIWLSYLT